MADNFNDFESIPNLVSMFLSRAALRGERPFLGYKHGDEWRTISWAETARRVAGLAKSLRAMGLKKGDRVMLVSENRPEWCIADLGIMAAGCVTVPTYITNTERDHQHILDNSQSRAVIVSTAKLAQHLMPAVVRSSECEFVIGMEPLKVTQRGQQKHHDWADLVQGTDADVAALTEEMAHVGRRELACIIYTSGTGGSPRGVMQHHGMILRNVDGAARILAEDFGWEDEVFLSFLPASHAYEHTGGQFLPIGMGGQIYYAEGLEKLASNIEEVRPTIMVVVPRLFEVLRARIIKQVEKQGKLATAMMDRALGIGGRKAHGGMRLRDRPVDFLLERLFRPKIREKFGGRIKALVSGGAPLNPEIGVFFDAMGLTMLQGYGQTEAGPVISVNLPWANRRQTVGKPLEGVECRIAGDGEVLVRGELVMAGYWGNAEATAAALHPDPQDPPGSAPWLHTGDVGEMEDGFLRITDRKRDFIKTLGGDMVSPAKIEGLLMAEPEIAQALVAGEGQPALVALIVPAEGMETRVDAAMQRVNGKLSTIERVRRWASVEPFTIDNGMLTPTMKVKRRVALDRHAAAVESLYQHR